MSRNYKIDFAFQLSDELPKKPPFICPYVGCQQEKNNGHLLILHYGVEHNISMDLYRKRNNKAQTMPHLNKKSIAGNCT